MKVTRTDEVGSWMDDLAARFSEIIEDQANKRPAHVDENGVKWTYARIEAITHIPERTLRRMVQSVRTSNDAAAAVVKRDKDQEAIVRSLRNRPEAVVKAIAELPEQQQAAIINRLVERFPKKPRPAPTSRPDALGVLDVITECRKAVSALSSAAGAVGMTDWDEETREAIHEIVAQMENYVSAIRSLVDGFDPEELLK